jgi:Uma2 family endonuclease
MRTQRTETLSPEDYLRRERRAELRHEYVDGVLYAMTGGTLRHNVVALNVASALKSALRAGPCRVFMSDAKLHVAHANSYYYPDVMVSCEEGLRELGPEDAVVSAPVLVVEVLSPATAVVDRREKLVAYRRIEALGEYLLIDPDGLRAELHRRVAGGWEQREYDPGDAVELASVGLTLPAATVFEGLGPI